MSPSLLTGAYLGSVLGGDDRRKVRALCDAGVTLFIDPGQGLGRRDIKPLNVILTRTGAKLLDFNIASRVSDAVYTQSGIPLPGPDVNLARRDVSTDLFRVGVLLYQLLCDGRHPYPRSRPMVDEQAIDPRTTRSDLKDATGWGAGRSKERQSGPRHTKRSTSGPEGPERPSTGAP